MITKGMQQPMLENTLESGQLRRMQDCYVKRIACGIDNSFIVRQGNRAIMVDTCRRHNRAKVMRAAREEGVSLIVLTHGHFDHVSNARAIAEALDIPIAMHSADVDLVSDNSYIKMHANTLIGHVELIALNRIFKYGRIEEFYPDLFLQEGDTLETFGIDAKVIGFPGHTMGSIGLDVWGTDLLVGDACITLPYPSKAMIYSNREEMEASCRKITSMGERTVHVGHGKSVPNRAW